jgi:hypothetical protein
MSFPTLVIRFVLTVLATMFALPFATLGLLYAIAYVGFRMGVMLVSEEWERWNFIDDEPTRMVRGRLGGWKR